MKSLSSIWLSYLGRSYCVFLSHVRRRLFRYACVGHQPLTYKVFYALDVCLLVAHSTQSTNLPEYLELHAILQLGDNALLGLKLDLVQQRSNPAHNPLSPP